VTSRHSYSDFQCRTVTEPSALYYPGTRQDKRGETDIILPHPTLQPLQSVFTRQRTEQSELHIVRREHLKEGGAAAPAFYTRPGNPLSLPAVCSTPRHNNNIYPTVLQVYRASLVHIIFRDRSVLANLHFISCISNLLDKSQFISLSSSVQTHSSDCDALY